jgi:hypothetical protein
MIGLIHLETEQGTTSVDKFAIFCNSFPQTIWKNNYLSAACLLAYANLLQSEKGKGKNQQ